MQETMLKKNLSSETRTSDAFNMIFNDDLARWNVVVLLVLSTTWSFFSCSLAHSKGLMARRDHFPMKSKLIAVLNSLVAILKRVTCNIIYYTPPLGLFSLLRHLQAEQIQFVGEPLRLVDENGKVQFGDVTPFLWNTIYRWDTDFNGNAKAPHYTLYSILSLRMYFILYLCITFCQTVAIFILKTKLSQGFTKLNILSKLLHCFENTNIPSPCEEWDSGSGNASEHYKRMKANKIENLAVIFTNFICNLLLLVPIFALGENMNID